MTIKSYIMSQKLIHGRSMAKKTAKVAITLVLTVLPMMSTVREANAVVDRGRFMLPFMQEKVHTDSLSGAACTVKDGNRLSYHKEGERTIVLDNFLMPGERLRDFLCRDGGALVITDTAKNEHDLILLPARLQAALRDFSAGFPTASAYPRWDITAVVHSNIETWEQSGDNIFGDRVFFLLKGNPAEKTDTGLLCIMSLNAPAGVQPAYRVPVAVHNARMQYRNNQLFIVAPTAGKLMVWQLSGEPGYRLLDLPHGAP